MLGLEFLEDDLGTRDRQLVTLPAHVLDQDGEVKLAAAGDLEPVRRIRRLDPKGDVVDQLLVEALAQLPARHELALAPGQRRIVDLEGHRDGRLVEDRKSQRLNSVTNAQLVCRLLLEKQKTI